MPVLKLQSKRQEKQEKRREKSRSWPIQQDQYICYKESYAVSGTELCSSYPAAEASPSPLPTPDPRSVPSLDRDRSARSNSYREEHPDIGLIAPFRLEDRDYFIKSASRKRISELPATFGAQCPEPIESEESLPSDKDWDRAKDIMLYDQQGEGRPFRSFIEGDQVMGSQQLVILVRHFFCGVSLIPAVNM